MARAPSKILSKAETKQLDLEKSITAQQKIVDKETKKLEKLIGKRKPAKRNAGPGDTGHEPVGGDSIDRGGQV